ncbi:MAG: 30S ribosomal protein S6 [Rhizobacter sp.]|nr:30S ribosomal protein S6 [Chlorobiales bacterium]
MNEKKLYETTFVVDGNLEDEAVQAVIEKVKGVITSLGGEIQNVSEQGRKKLAYTIRKATIGFYVHIEFMSEGPLLKELERQYRLNEQVIRFLTIILDKRLLEMRERVLKYGTAPVAVAGQEGEAAVPQPVKA